MSFEEEVERIEKRIDTLSSETLKRFLHLYLSANGLMVLWVRENKPDKKGRRVNINSVMTYLGVSRRTAWDYVRAYQLIEEIMQLYCTSVSILLKSTKNQHSQNLSL